MNRKDFLNELSDAQLLTYARLEQMNPKEGLSREALVELMDSKLALTEKTKEQESLVRILALASKVEEGLGEWNKEKQESLEAIRKTLADVTSVAHKGETIVCNAAHEAEKAIEQVAALIRNDGQLAVTNAKIAATKAEAEASKATAAAGDQQTILKLSQGLVALLGVLAAVAIGTGGVLTVLNLFNTRDQLAVVQKLTENARAEETTIKEQQSKIGDLESRAERTAARLRDTDSGLREFLFLSLFDRSQRIAERISSKMSPEDISDITTQLRQVQPLLISLRKTLHSDRDSDQGSLDVHRALETFLANVSLTLPLANATWSATNKEAMDALDHILNVWKVKLPPGTNALTTSLSTALTRLAAYRENMIGNVLLLRLDRIDEATRLREKTQLRSDSEKHFEEAIKIDPTFARPHNSLGVAFARRIREELRSQNPNAIAISNNYVLATNYYSQALARAVESRTRLLIFNNQATAAYRWAWSLAIVESNVLAAQSVYSQCKHTIAKAERTEGKDSTMLETKAESLGIEAILGADESRLKQLESEILVLFEEAKSVDLDLEATEEYIRNSPLKFVQQRDASFRNKLFIILKK